MTSATVQSARTRVKTVAEQLADQAHSNAIDDLRALYVDLIEEADAADMLESFDAAVDAAGTLDGAVDVARSMVCEATHTTWEGGALTRLAVEHADDVSEIEPSPPPSFVSEA